MNSRLSPADAFPEDLTVLEDIDLQVLHSRVHRQVDYEYAHDFEVNPETEFRAAEIAEEFEHRELPTSPWRSLMQSMLQS
ncbi:hypothetical protein PTW37_15410 [Arthrobacter agilis]|uniref:hypothetical protein n=1 Tax=Arthrobacter agilis TaxID=37921 RepID=UPI002365CF5C|nr:hypothetical protein [Arthrobacter agilis]WDF33214.1 hypothetical protein PTW37_15410 [Arthrobacter agilis]